MATPSRPQKIFRGTSTTARASSQQHSRAACSGPDGSPRNLNAGPQMDAERIFKEAAQDVRNEIAAMEFIPPQSRGTSAAVRDVDRSKPTSSRSASAE